MADVKGLDLRTMQAPLQILAWQSMGANPTPMNWGEVYTAMQQGVLSAVENPSYVFTQSKISETITDFTRSRHIYDPIVIIGGKVTFDRLPADLQALVKTTLSDLTAKERAIVDADVTASEAEMTAAGIKVGDLDEAVRKELADAARPPVLERLTADLGADEVTVWTEAVAKAAK